MGKIIEDSIAAGQAYLDALASKASTEWPDPRPIKSELPSAPSFDAGLLLPSALATYVSDEADRMPCAADYVGASLLVALGATIGSRCALKPKRCDDWLTTPNFFGGVVGDPSSKKSPAIDKGWRFLDRLEADESDRHAKEMITFEAETAAHAAREAAVNAAMKAAAGGKKSDPDAMALAVRQMAELQPPDEPVARRYKTSDATVPKLADLLAKSPDGMLIARDELTGWLASFDQPGHEGDRAFFLEGWNGLGAFTVDRVGRGTVLIKRLTISVFGGIQPELMGRFLQGITTSARNDGLLQRFGVLVYPDQVEWQWRDRYPSPGSREAVRDVFLRLACFDPTQDGAAPATDFQKVPAFQFDNAAQEIFVEWSGDLHRNVIAGESNPLIAQHFAKYEKLFCGIALTLHLAGGEVGPVKADSALRAAAWCQYLAGHARRVYALADVARTSAAQSLARRLAAGSLQNGFTVRDVVRKGWSGLTAHRDVEAALAALEDFGYVSSHERDEAIGRPTVRYSINPAIGREVSR
jgi:hypothetical protein